jgi:hypothetical protein
LRFTVKQNNYDHQKLIGIMLTVAFLLLMPFITIQFTNEVDWNLSDFVIAGILLLDAGLLYELVWRKLTSSPA